MHAIQTSGNCVRNITTDHFAGVARRRDRRSAPWCELIRQWSTFHPGVRLPAAQVQDRGERRRRPTAPRSCVHDIGLHAVRDARAKSGFSVIVGGGLGRTPIIGHVIREFLPWRHLLTYLDAILRVYNRYGRRDNIYKARIKILVKERDARRVRAAGRSRVGAPARTARRRCRARRSRASPARFTRPAYETSPRQTSHSRGGRRQPPFARWAERNVHPHKGRGYASVTLSLKKTGVPPGDVTAEQMDAIADLADRYSFGELRVTHEQNLIFADVRQSDLHALWHEAARRSGSRRRTSACSPTSSAARAATSARSPTRSRSRSPRRSSAASTTSTTCTTSASSTSTSRAA